ncbi:MAG: hypothetical protein IT380_03160 [Myxococcales bacterium]|nr:hypothetical protein [Myxococcales bacterium]
MLTTRLARGVLPALTIGLALLAVAPWLEAPFSTPKRLVLTGAAALAALLLPMSRRRLAWPFLLPLLSTGLSAWRGDFAATEVVWAQLAFGVLVFAWASSGVEARWVTPAAAGCGAVVGLVAVLQAAGVDPFAAFGPEVSGRLRVYSTLGNPDFVASALTVALCLAAGEWSTARSLGGAPGKSVWWLAAMGLMLAALAVTRSFATLAAISAAAAAAGLHGLRRRAALPATVPSNLRRRHVGVTVAVVLGALGLLTALLAGRSPSEAMLGRLYLARVVVSAGLEAPVLGHGPGAVEALWPEWELSWWKARCGADASCVAADAWSRFAGLQDHVHNDWLELLVERGLAGLIASLLVLALALQRAWKSSAPRAPALFATVVAVAVRATVDFPLARPADLCLLAAVVGLVVSLEDE